MTPSNTMVTSVTWTLSQEERDHFASAEEALLERLRQLVRLTRDYRGEMQLSVRVTLN